MAAQIESSERLSADLRHELKATDDSVGKSIDMLQSKQESCAVQVTRLATSLQQCHVSRPTVHLLTAIAARNYTY